MVRSRGQVMFCDHSNRNVRYGSKNISEWLRTRTIADITQDPHNPNFGTPNVRTW